MVLIDINLRIETATMQITITMIHPPNIMTKPVRGSTIYKIIKINLFPDAVVFVAIAIVDILVEVATFLVEFREVMLMSASGFLKLTINFNTFLCMQLATSCKRTQIFI